MGTWNTGVFDNDEAMDWLKELATSGRTELLSESLKPVSASYLEAPEGWRVLCAAAAVAAVLNQTGGGEPDELKAWADASTGNEVRPLVPAAIAGVLRVLAEGSELSDLWQENEDEYPEWEGHTRRLLERLQAV